MDQYKAVSGLVDYLGIHCSDARIRAICSEIYSPSSLTFRHPQIGNWKKHFRTCHIEALKNSASELLIHYGYEDDINW